jgi:MOSC domain-containing protein YiiM
MITTLIDALLIGGPKPFRADGTMSAMAREGADGPVWLTKTGFTGDQVADPSVHGGQDKAVHFYLSSSSGACSLNLATRFSSASSISNRQPLAS